MIGSVMLVLPGIIVSDGLIMSLLIMTVVYLVSWFTVDAIIKV